MAQEDDFDRGVKNRRAVLGDEWVDRSLDNTTEFNAEFQALITRYAWHDIWGRPGLDHETRRLLVLGMTMGMARWEEFELHCRATVRHGVSVDKIKETLMQGAIYCGVPAANTAFKITSRILQEEGRLPPAQPLSAPVRVATHHTFSEPQLKVAVQGKGPPLVLSHALGLDLTMWDALAADLAGHWRIARYDHRGQGGSAVPAGSFTLDQLVDDAARLIREWGRGPVVFVGLSMGGMVGQGLAIRHPELVRALVLANTAARYPEEGRAGMRQRLDAVRQGGLAAVADATMERFFNAGFRARHPDTVARFRATLLRADAAGYAASVAAIADVDWLDRLPQIACPTLVIGGSADAGTPLPLSQAIVERIPGAQLRVIDGAAHLSVIDEAPAFTRVLREFLASLA